MSYLWRCWLCSAKGEADNELIVWSEWLAHYLRHHRVRT